MILSEAMATLMKVSCFEMKFFPNVMAKSATMYDTSL